MTSAMLGKKKLNAARRSGNYESVPLVEPGASGLDPNEQMGGLSFHSPFEFNPPADSDPELEKRYRSIFTYNHSSEVQCARSNTPRGGIHLILTLMGYSIVVLLFPLLGWFSLKRLRNHERMVVFRFGRLIEPKGPGMVAVLPLVDKCEVVSLANKAFSIPPGMIHCEDGGIVEAGGEVIFRVLSPVPAVTEVCDRDRALRNLCQATLRTVVSKFETERIDKLRPEIVRHMHESINKQIIRWGIEVSRVDLIGIRVLKTPPSILSRFNLSSLGQHIGPMLAPLFAQMSNPNDPNAAAASSSAAASTFVTMPVLVPPPENEADITAPEVACAPEPPATSVEWLLEQMRVKLGNEKIRRSLDGGVFAFHIYEEGEKTRAERSEPTRYCLDARSGFVGEGEPADGAKPDVTLTMRRAALMDLLLGETSPTSAYMSGDIAVDGELKTAMRLQALNS